MFQNWAWSQGMKFNSKVHDLTYFFWETTLRCNLKCRHCGSDCDKDKTVEDLQDDFFFCGAGVNVGSLLADGSYSACPSLSREWIQGHVDEIAFTEAWETRYKNMRDRKWMRTEVCKSCRQCNKCNG
jgi:radical SAM protein with 4Fe4S-binding SPASM domain